jgi:hypothetical protein
MTADTKNGRLFFCIDYSYQSIKKLKTGATINYFSSSGRDEKEVAVLNIGETDIAAFI